ncbi:MAG: DUF6045 family protein [Bacillota bacterium]
MWGITVDGVLDQLCDWLYGKVVEFFGEFLTMINHMGAELFNMNWVKAVILFFSYFAWSLYIVGMVTAVFDVAIASQNGKGNLQDVGINMIKGFFAVSLFTVVPIRLYTFCINLSSGLIGAISGLTSSPGSIGVLGQSLIVGMIRPPNVLIGIVFVILVGYSVIKVFFANLKRGGILLTLIAVGSLYHFGVVRGFSDGFVAWCKQVIALCLTAFLQTVILVLGLVTYNVDMLLAIGLMLSSTEVPRIAGNFGLETGTKINVMSTLYSTRSLVSMGKSVMKLKP